MSKKVVEAVWENPVDDSTEENVAEEFRFRPHRLERVKPGIRKIGVHLYLDEDILAHFQKIAQRPDAPAWQTLVNQVLRKAVGQGEAGTSLADQAKAGIENIVSSEPFVTAVADRIADRVADRLKKKTGKKAA
ncbi:MAG: BrnA antitoxin family protein [Acidobacteriota bacterium]